VDPFIAEIRIFPFDFAPRGWAVCDGQLISIPQNTALFSILGTTYGGNGTSNFALPNLQGSVPMMPGQGPGLPPHDLGDTGGVTTVTLSTAHMPMHWHAWNGSFQPAEDRTPANEYIARASGGNLYHSGLNDLTNVVAMAPQAISAAGSQLPQPHNNMQPFLTVNFCIALQGVHPPRP
jgi:microcystin-dependent protein